MLAAAGAWAARAAGARRRPAKALLVTYRGRAFDVAQFADDHPGGAELLAEFRGRDISEIMHDAASHAHSPAAFEILDEYEVGREKASKDVAGLTDTSDDSAAATRDDSAANKTDSGDDADTLEVSLTSKEGASVGETLSGRASKAFLDINKPLVPQMWANNYSKAFYLEQVHIPRHLKNGRSALLFGNALEPLSRTPWWVVPLFWLPWVAYCSAVSLSLYSVPVHAALFAIGAGMWAVFEYVFHRFLFHMENDLPDHRVALTLHFIVHGIHHFLPMDRLRLVMPPALFLILSAPVYALARHYFGDHTYGLAAGTYFGYVAYDMTHYYLHHGDIKLAYLREMKTYHLKHHYVDYNKMFGVTSKTLDWVFSSW